jgi:AraC-like DNA-binding protein
MVRSGQHPIRTVVYRSPADAPFGVEVMSFEHLRALAARSWRAAPQRPRFHVLAVVEAGGGHHSVDFERYPLEPGSVVWIRPGRVHQWDGVEHVQGTLVLFQPDFLTPGTFAQAAADDVFGPAGWRLEARGGALAAAALEHLRAEYAGGAGDPVPQRTEVLRNLLGALVLRLLPRGEQMAGSRSGVALSGDAGAFVSFRQAVEEDFARSRQVSWYARRLGYSAKTLTRATRAAVGVGAKEFIDERVVLEAKRLLAFGDLTAAQCAARLGFDDTANFGKFFERGAGCTPGAFREESGAGGGS